MEAILKDAEALYQLLTQLRQAGLDALPSELTQLSPPLITLLEQVANHPGSTIMDLAERVGRSAPTISIAIRHLEEAGYVTRHPHPKDKRSVQIFLTPKGESLHVKVQTARRATFARLLSGLSSSERETLLSLLEKAIATLKNSPLENAR